MRNDDPIFERRGKEEKPLNAITPSFSADSRGGRRRKLKILENTLRCNYTFLCRF
jgi:hypothetical protein